VTTLLPLEDVLSELKEMLNSHIAPFLPLSTSLFPNSRWGFAHHLKTPRQGVPDSMGKLPCREVRLVLSTAKELRWGWIPLYRRGTSKLLWLRDYWLRCRLLSKVYRRDASKQRHQNNSLNINTNLPTTPGATQRNAWQRQEPKG